MAINTTKATIQMRRGSEAAFNPDKMMPGEWAVSLDSRYVRMCFAPGLCLRMATYEGFEEDMKEIQKILKECQDINASVKHFEQLAQEHSVESESWAVGGTGTRDGEDTNNSRYFSELAKRIVNAATQGALIPMGTIPFESLPTSNIESGWMYNISNAFTSDSRFEDGGGIKYPMGVNVYYTAGGKWDVLAGMQVTGVKGSAESDYRTGDVNLKPNDLFASSLLPLDFIPRNSDLDNYDTPGCYRSENSTVSSSILHSPVTASGYMLEVYNINGLTDSAYRTQIVKTYMGEEFVRFRTKDLKWSDWVRRNAPMTGATASAAGKAGLVPAPAAGAQTKFLMGSGAWGNAFISRGEYTGNIDNLYGYEKIGTYFVLSTNITGTLPDDIVTGYYVLDIFTASPNICVQLLLSLGRNNIYMRGRTSVGWGKWFSTKKIVYSPFSDFPSVGDPQVLYIDDTTDPRLMYTWDSSTSKYILTGGAGGADGSSIDIPITLPASGWTGTAAPYSQTITVPQIRESMTPLLFFSGTGDAAQYAYSLITGYEAGYAQMTFSAADKPQVDIPITLKGIPAQQLEFADNTVVVVVPADGFVLNEDVGRYEQTITVEGMTPGMGGMFDIVRSGPVLTVEESKIVASITDIIRLEGAIKIVCLEPPEQQYMLALYGTYTQATEGTTLLAGMDVWFDRVQELEANALFYIDRKIVTKADSGSAPWSAYGAMSVAVASSTLVSAQITGDSTHYGVVTLNINTNTAYVYSASAGEYTIRVLYAHTS